MNEEELIKACFTLMKYCVSNDYAAGADINIDTPDGEVHFTYDFTLTPKDQEDE